VLEDAVDRRRKSPSPLLIEAKTYRFRGHSISDPATYRKKEEVERYRSVDPIGHVKRVLAETGWLDEQGVKALEQDVRRELLEAVEFAENSPEPDAGEVSQDVL